MRTSKQLENWKSNIIKLMEKLKHTIFVYTPKISIKLSRNILISVKTSIYLYRFASYFQLLTGILRFLILWFIMGELYGYTTLTSEGMHWLCRFRPITRCLNHQKDLKLLLVEENCEEICQLNASKLHFNTEQCKTDSILQENSLRKANNFLIECCGFFLISQIYSKNLENPKDLELIN